MLLQMRLYCSFRRQMRRIRTKQRNRKHHIEDSSCPDLESDIDKSAAEL